MYARHTFDKKWLSSNETTFSISTISTNQIDQWISKVVSDKIVFLNNLTSTISRFFNFFYWSFFDYIFYQYQNFVYQNQRYQYSFFDEKNTQFALLFFSRKKSLRLIFENEFDSRNSYQNRERERKRERSKFSTKKEKFDENRDNKNKTYIINEKNESNTIEKIEKVFHNENRSNEAFYS